MKDTDRLKAANTLFTASYEKECLRVNHFMFWLMIAQWFAGIGFAIFFSPFTWIGQHSEVHLHVWAAVIIGGSISSFAILWLRFFPREAHTRHVVATAQVLWSALLIHLSGGRIETHFHVFASLAILSIYRDWKILITATIVVAIDHLIRGIYYPLSAFGVFVESPYRWLEHAAWVLFEIAFLVPSCKRLKNEIRELCRRQTEIEEASQTLDNKVDERTMDLLMANKLLAESEERFQQIAGTLDDVLWMASATGEQMYYVSPAYEQIWGRSCQTLYKSPGEWLEGIHPDDVEKASIVFETCAQGGSYHEEYRVVRPDGSETYVQSSAFPIRNKEGKIYRVGGVVRDVTEHNRIEQLKLDKQHAEQANLAKSQFLATISHELRTPLNGVIGMTELLIGTELDSKQENYVKTCQYSARSLLDLISDILDFSKIEAGKLSLDFHEFDLEELVAETVTTATWKTIEKNIDLTCFIDDSSRAVVYSDSVRIRQVLNNLISNAVKFTNDGEVKIRVETISKEENAIHVRLSVQDTGIGIPADKIGRLFNSFAQVDPSTTRKFGGTGLGLAISKRLVELLGGSIEVESEEGVGSRFWCEIPLQVCDKAETQRPQTEPFSFQNVLIIDKSKASAEILAEYVSELGFNASFVTSLADAKSTIKTTYCTDNPLDLVFGTNELLNATKTDSLRTGAKASPKFIQLLGPHDPQDSVAELRARGIATTLRKPFKRSELHNSIKLAINGPDQCPQQEQTKKNKRVDFANIALDARILLVEDNKINQMFMCELLKQFGCRVDLAANGKECVELAVINKYDLIFMDCQMPVMDGLEATRKIREMESIAKQKQHIPIIALTASAIKGDRQKCIDAGMDEYLTKPIQKMQIAQTLERFLKQLTKVKPMQNSSKTVKQTQSKESSQPIDCDQLLERCFGNVEFAVSLLEEFASNGAERADTIKQLGLKQDAQGMADAAHSLKGAAGIMCADELQTLSKIIEDAGRKNDLESIASTLMSITNEMDRCLEYIPQLTAQMQSSDCAELGSTADGVPNDNV
jgi:two-component system, sensor histidine kinase and response regulator